VADSPTCPKCSRPMQLKTARRGRNAGSQFWSCVGYATGECNGTLDVGEWEGSERWDDGSGLARVRGTRASAVNIGEPRLVITRPLHRGLETVYFDLMTVAKNALEDVQEAHLSDRPVVGSQWRL